MGRWGRPVNWLMGLALITSCQQQPTAFEDDHVFLPNAATWSRALEPDPPVLFLNRCEGGCTLYPGTNDSRTNHSTIVTSSITLAPFRHTDEVWEDTIRCVKRHFEDFEIIITDVDPGSEPHFESIVTGEPTDLDLSPTIGGISPMTCGVIQNVVNFTFANAYGENAQAICDTIAHENGHSFGIDHLYLCDDLMTYLPACGEKAFQRVDAKCGEREERSCSCSEHYQNSYLTLLDAFGPRTVPLTWPPKVWFDAPLDEDEVEPRFRIHVMAETKNDDPSDDTVIALVELYIDGALAGTSSVAPHVFFTPTDIAMGDHQLRARGVDTNGQEDTSEIGIIVVPARERPDAGEPDLGTPKPPWWTQVTDAGFDAGMAPRPAPIQRQDEGCRCVAQKNSLPLALVVMLLGWFAFLIGRRRIWALLLLCIGCADEDNLGKVRPELLIDPPNGTLLQFEQVTLEHPGRFGSSPYVYNEGASPNILTVVNGGSSNLELTSVRVEMINSPFRVSSSPRLLAPSQFGEIFVRFEPIAAGEWQDTLTIDSNDPTRPVVTYPLRGSSRDPCVIYVTPSRQRLMVGETGTVEIKSWTSATCVITDLAIDPLLFRLVNEPELPFEIAGGESFALNVEHLERTKVAGRPIRQLRVKESEGMRVEVTIEGELPIWNCLEVYPREMSFPEVGLGLTSHARATVINFCEEPALITSAQINSGYYFYQVEESRFPIRVEPWSEESVWVAYEAFSEWTDPGRLVIDTNDAANGRFTVDLVGKGVRPKIKVLPRVEYGSVRYSPSVECASAVHWVPIFSVGEVDLMIRGLEIDRHADGQFEIVGAEVDGTYVDHTEPFFIPPNKVGRVGIRFTPERRDPAEHRGVLKIEHTADYREKEVLLVGYAADDAPAIDRFTHPMGPRTDVLFVIDNSASMSAEQEILYSHVGELMAYADSLDAEYRLAATSADDTSSRSGIFNRCNVLHPYVLTWDYLTPQERADVTVCTMRVGSRSRQPQAGLGAAMRAIERSLDFTRPDPERNPNIDFLRREAKLALVVVSNEEDQTEESPEIVRDFLYAVKGRYRPDRLSVHAIAGPTDVPCTSGAQWVQPGHRYRFLTEETGGSFHNICGTDWSTIMSNLAQSVFVPLVEYDLSQAADSATIVVSVDGNAITNGATDGYTYNPRANSVRFHGAAVPAPGAEIQVSYNGLCR